MRFRRRKAVPVAERAAAGVLWRVLCFFVLHPGIPDIRLRNTTVRKTMRTRHATHPTAVPLVERVAEEGGGGGLTGGPLVGQTNRGSNPQPRRAPAKAHTTRPSMSLTQ